jgi:hypothetical protein
LSVFGVAVILNVRAMLYFAVVEGANFIIGRVVEVVTGETYREQEK